MDLTIYTRNSFAHTKSMQKPIENRDKMYFRLSVRLFGRLCDVMTQKYIEKTLEDLQFFPWI